MPPLSYHRPGSESIQRVDRMPKPREVLLETKRFRVVREERTSPSGKTHLSETIEHPGAVTILPLLEGDRVCLIQNYRPSVDRTLIELPAGTLETGEDPAHTAVRELREETGYQAESMRLLAEFFMSPGILSERMYLYAATGLVLGERELDAGEEIERLEVPWSEALAMVRRGTIEDVKTLFGLLFYDDMRREQSESGRGR